MFMVNARSTAGPHLSFRTIKIPRRDDEPSDAVIDIRSPACTTPMSVARGASSGPPPIH